MLNLLHETICISSWISEYENTAPLILHYSMMSNRGDVIQECVTWHFVTINLTINIWSK